MAASGRIIRKRSPIIAILASLFCHWAILWLIALRLQPLKVEPVTWVTLTNTDTSVQIADLTLSANRIRPESARFIGTEHHATSEETVAVHRGAAGSPHRPQAIRRQTKLSEERSAGEENRPEHAIREPTTLSPKLPPTAVTEALGPGLGNYLPEDYFPDYRHAGHTYLNVLKRPGVDYFVQLKRTFKLAWDPVPAVRVHYMANEISRGNIKVVLGVSVDRTGSLGELFILKGSGLAGYDQEALRTIRASAPFASPPPNLLAVDGSLRMSWTFIVYL